MPAGDKVLVRSFPADPIVRQIYDENEDTILVWRGTMEPNDLPAPCPKDCVFIYDAELEEELKNELRRNDLDPLALSRLWTKAKPYYK